MSLCSMDEIMDAIAIISSRPPYLYSTQDLILLSFPFLYLSPLLVLAPARADPFSLVWFGLALASLDLADLGWTLVWAGAQRAWIGFGVESTNNF